MPRLLNAGKRIVFFSLLTILFTGILVGLSTSLPMYYSIRTHIEQVNLANARAQADAIDNDFERYHALAAQFTSRTEIRKRLEAYHAQQLSLAELQAYSQPRLAEPARHIADLKAMVRVAADGQVVAAVGELAEQVRTLDFSEVAQKVISLSEPPVDLIRVTAAISNSATEQVGVDILYFDAQTLAPLLSDFSTYAGDAKLNLISQDAELSLGYVAERQQVVRQELAPELSRALAGHEYRQAAMLDVQGEQLTKLLYLPLGETASGLLIQIPEAIFYQAAYQDLLWAYLAILVMLVLGASISYYTVKPVIIRLTRQAAKIEDNALQLQMAASVFEQAQQAIIITDAQLNIVRANPGAKKILDMVGISVEQRNLKEFLSGDGCDNQLLSAKGMPALLEDQDCWQGEVCYKKSSTDQQGFTHTLQDVTRVNNPRGKASYFIHILSDITARKAAHNHIVHLATHDALTGLPNRNALMTRLAYCVEKKHGFAVLFIDLDKFKPINDTYGHQVGDQLLSEVAQRIRSVVRAKDIVGRLGGDEFLMIVESEQDGLRADVIANKIIEQVIKPYHINDRVLSVGASVGVACYPQDADSPDRLIQAADAAMYKAKQAGGNQFCVK